MWVKADMHIHSTYSDGKASPRDILLYAREKNLSVIAITDHDTFQGAVVAAKEAARSYEDLVVVIGCEVRSSKGDILVYCNEPFNTPREVEHLIDKAHENNCLVVPAHPYDTYRYGIGDHIYEYKGWDAVEVWNAASTKGANRKAERAARVLNLPGLSNSDAHVVEYIGVAYTLIDVDRLNLESVLESIRKGRVKPIYGYPPFSALVSRIAWFIERSVRKSFSLE